MEQTQTSDKTIQLRASQFDRDLIDHAANLAGINRTQFMLGAAIREAKNLLLDQTALFVDADSFAAIIDQLDNPTPISENLQKTLTATSPWDRD